jgi:PEP-CTERM motif
MKTKLFAATVLAAASASAFAVGPGALGAIDNTPIAISNIVPMGIFQDVYSFTLVNPGELSGSVVAINFTPYNIQGLTVTLQDSSFAVIGSDASPATGFTFSNLASGNYALNVLGFADGSKGGFYSGGMIATTVPEPETYALLLAGLGIVGFVASRRRAQG